jgi:hypothetical protein
MHSMSAMNPDRATELGSHDQRVTMYGIAWTGYEAQLALRGESSVPRVAYLDGAMEVLHPPVIMNASPRISVA